MIIDNSKFDFSLNDTTELRSLILENPELPILIFCGEDSWHDEWSYEQAVVNGRPSIQELTLYKDCWMERDDYEDRLRDDLCDDEEYAQMSDECFDAAVNKIIATTKFAKAIVIYVG